MLIQDDLVDCNTNLKRDAMDIDGIDEGDNSD
jgi:hypothetical protein